MKRSMGQEGNHKMLTVALNHDGRYWLRGESVLPTSEVPSPSGGRSSCFAATVASHGKDASREATRLMRIPFPRSGFTTFWVGIDATARKVCPLTAPEPRPRSRSLAIQPERRQDCHTHGAGFGVKVTPNWSCIWLGLGPVDSMM